MGVSQTVVVAVTPSTTLRTSVLYSENFFGLTRSGQSLRGDRNNGPAHYQVVPLTSALSMYTLGAAYAEGTEEFKGSIEPGKLADLTLLDADVAGLDPSELMGVRAAKTIIEGRLVWES